MVRMRDSDFSPKLAKIDRGIAAIRPFTLLFLDYVIFVFVDVSRSVMKLGNATYVDRLLVAPELSTRNFTLIGNDEFWSRHTNSASKCR